jgi:hypothetical protein
LIRAFDTKLSIYLIFSFILFTIIGTVSHELGHYSVAKFLGYNTSINYGHTSWGDNSERKKLYAYHKKYLNEIKNNIDFPGKTEYRLLETKLANDSLMISIGGPLQTILTGTLGFILLCLNRKKYTSSESLTIKHWFIIFLALFWLRQLFNFAHGIIIYLMKGYFPSSNDEAGIASSLGLNKFSITITTAIIATFILAMIVFKYIPIKQRLTFVISGLLGGLLGFYIWLIAIGPIVMP